MTITTFEHRFVDEIPDQLDEAVLYVSIPYAIAIHLCACGCRCETVTPIAPTEWSMTFDGASVGLSPSIGNWRLPCRSHYWIRNGTVMWAPAWSKEDLRQRNADRTARNDHSGANSPTPMPPKDRGWIARLLSRRR